MIRSKLNGKRMLGLGVVLAILTAGVIWQVTAPEGQAQSVGGFNGLVVTVNDLDTVALNSGGTGTPVPVYQTASVNDTVIGEEVGVLRVWGVKTVEGSGTVTVLNANLELDGFNGTLAMQGTVFEKVVDILDRDDILAVTGGTGTFRGANGEATLHDNGDGTITIRLKEVKRR